MTKSLFRTLNFLKVIAKKLAIIKSNKQFTLELFIEITPSPSQNLFHIKNHCAENCYISLCMEKKKLTICFGNKTTELPTFFSETSDCCHKTLVFRHTISSRCTKKKNKKISHFVSSTLYNFQHTIFVTWLQL